MQQAERVGKLHLQGKNATQIARELDVTRASVVRSLQDFQGMLRHNSETATDLRDRLMDIVFEADASYRLIIDESWETAKAADASGQLNTKINALKLVESATKNRSTMLTQAGVSQDNEIIDQLNETERRQEILIKLLREIKDEHPEVAEVIARRLSQVQDEVEAIIIEGDIS